MICPFILSLVPRILSPVSSAIYRVFSIDFLQANSSLQVLNLSDNEISDAGAAALAEALKVVLGAQILIFRLETCFLFAHIVNSSTIPPLPQSLLFKTQPYFINAVANRFHKLPCVLSLVSSPR